ncbi:MAG: hypothetical protein ACLPND_24040 [Candidatus Korobacteraceae bacterium]|jgi:hypothetical protein
MVRFAKLLFLVVIAAAFCLGQNAKAAQMSQPAAQTPPAAETPAPTDKAHGAMPAQLTKSLDSKKMKEGDEVTGRITAEIHTRDGLTIPRDSKLIGHVTEAKARSKGDPSSALGIVFDKISMPGGKDVAIKGVIQAVGPNPSASSQNAGSSGPGPGMMAGHEGAGVGTTPPPMPSMPSGPQPGAPILTGQSKGVVGIKNLELGDNSVLLSGGKEVKLDSGAQLIVMVELE